MFLCACAYSVRSGDSASNAVVKRSVFIKQRFAESACLYYGLRACGQKYIIIIICDRLRKSCTTVEQARWRHRMKFNENCSHRNEELVAAPALTSPALTSPALTSTLFFFWAFLQYVAKISNCWTTRSSTVQACWSYTLKKAFEHVKHLRRVSGSKPPVIGIY